MKIAVRADALVSSIYPEIASGKPHHMTRKKQRIAWQLGYMKGFEEARRMQFHKHIEVNRDSANAEEPTQVP